LHSCGRASRPLNAYDLQNLTKDFWVTIEERIYDALRDYANQAESGGGFQRRLFAEDAAQGFAFIDICRKSYDVALMNPPFGELSKNVKVYVEEQYPSSKGNILAHFLERATLWTTENAQLGAIVSRTCFFLTSLSDFRTKILSRRLHVEAFADLGSGVLDATVETAAVIFNRQTPKAAEFFRLLHLDVKDEILRRDLDCVAQGIVSDNTFLFHPKHLEDLTGQPYVYWVNPKIIGKIAEHSTLDPSGGQIRVGLQTGDDWRFLRLWFEVSQIEIATALPSHNVTELQCRYRDATKVNATWTFYSKIDEASAFAASIHLLVHWQADGKEIKAAHVHNGDSISRYVRSEDSYFKPGISYMLRSSRLVPYVVPKGVIPTAGRSQIYPIEGKEAWLLALTASNLGSAVARFRGEEFARPKLQNSMVSAIPYVDATPQLTATLNATTKRKIDRKRVTVQGSGRLSANFVPAEPLTAA
jgi:hypothetical protein